MVLTIAAELDYEVYMLDVQTTFLNADVEEEVFVKMAPGYEQRVRSSIIKLKKSLYGLRESLNDWFNTIDHHLGEIGFRSLKLDPCVYDYGDENGCSLWTVSR